MIFHTGLMALYEVMSSHIHKLLTFAFFFTLMYFSLLLLEIEEVHKLSSTEHSLSKILEEAI